MEDDEKVAFESEIATLKAELEKITAENNTKADEITRLQTYICKKLSSDKVDNPTDEKDFATLYRNTLKELGE